MTRRMTDHGIHWIGATPSAWKLVTLKSLIGIQNGDWGSDPGEIDVSGTVLTCYRKADFTQTGTVGNGETLRRLTRKPFVRHSDILLEKSGGGDATPVGAVAIVTASAPAACSNFLARLRANESGVEPRFIWRFLSAVHASPKILSLFKQTTGIQNVDMGALAALEVPLPDFLEQRRIADWLDLQTTHIDKRRELLAKKRELLQYLKKSVTQEATFRGIARDVEMRDSEIAWLGQVPSHWTTVRIGTLFREAADDGVDGLPMLSVSIHSGISDKELDEVEMERKVSRSEDVTLYKRVKPGDLVYNQMRAWQGAFGAATVEGLVSPAYVVARPGPSVLPGFVEYLLRAPAAMEEIRRRSRGITEFRLRLYWNEFKNIRIALPPLKEQVEITAFLDRKLSQIARQITLIDQLDDLLKQQRKAIIYEAVTGKIDLSSAAVG